jgi:hypothetical protein
MRRALLAIVLFAFACQTTSPGDPLAAFRYRAARVPAAGTVVHYLKSNLDGSKPSLVSLYFVDPEDIEVSKSEAGFSDSIDIKAHLDYKRYVADRLDSGVITSNGARVSKATLVIGRDELTASVDHFEQRLTSNVYPLHLYNFDLMGLNVMLPHLRNPQRNFTIGFVEPTFGFKDGAIELRGRATAAYLGDEAVDGRRAHVYRITGAGLAHAEALLWVDAGDGLIDLVESPLPNNPEWSSYRLARRGTTEHMSPIEWEAFKRSHVGVGAGSLQ